jgi:RNA polymerase primary sigma factor
MTSQTSLGLGSKSVHLEQARSRNSPTLTPEPNDVAEDGLALFIAKIARTPLLTAVEEIALARRIERGDLAAKERMVAANLRLVVFVARRYVGHGLAFADLVQEGTIGLIRAVEKFDHRRGNKFSTYAMGWVSQAMARALANNARTIRLPVHRVDRLRQIERAERRLVVVLGRAPSLEDLSAATGLSCKNIAEIKASARELVSLQAPVSENEGIELGELISDGGAESPEDAAARALRRDALREELENLPDRERRILELRFGLDDGCPRSLAAVGEVFGLTRERVRQIQDCSLDHLRRSPGHERLRDAA